MKLQHDLGVTRFHSLQTDDSSYYPVFCPSLLKALQVSWGQVFSPRRLKQVFPSLYKCWWRKAATVTVLLLTTGVRCALLIITSFPSRLFRFIEWLISAIDSVCLQQYSVPKTQPSSWHPCFVVRRSRVQISTHTPVTLTEVVRDFPQFLQENSRTMHEIRPRPLPSVSFTIH
jgi:hypothetical protein